MNISPLFGTIHLSNSCTMVDFPMPLFPTIAIGCPFSILKLISLSKGAFLLYENEICLNSIWGFSIWFERGLLS